MYALRLSSLFTKHYRQMIRLEFFEYFLFDQIIHLHHIVHTTLTAFHTKMPRKKFTL